MIRKGVAVLLLVLAFICWYFFPIIKPFPPLTGKYIVSTRVIDLIDTTRQEIWSHAADIDRKINVRFYYPAQYTAGSKQYPYFGEKLPGLIDLMTKQFGIPLWIGKLSLSGIVTHVYKDTLMCSLKDTYPVVLFSHGLLGLPTDISLAIIEQIASNGYVVVAIDHTYLNALTRFSDGTVITSQSLSEKFNQMSRIDQEAFQEKAISVYLKDMKFVLDELQKINEDASHLFYNRLNLDRVVSMGYSAGGTASIEFCRMDARCKAAIDIDGWYDHVIAQDPIDKPLLLIFGSKSLEIVEPTNDYLKRKGLSREQYFTREAKIARHREEICSEPSCRLVVVPDAAHSDFSDDAFIKWPFRAWNAVDPYKMFNLINSSIIAFLHENMA